jgi:hypothetical protein
MGQADLHSRSPNQTIKPPLADDALLTIATGERQEVAALGRGGPLSCACSRANELVLPQAFVRVEDRPHHDEASHHGADGFPTFACTGYAPP